MSQAAALSVLLYFAAAPGSLPGRVGAVEAADLLDGTVLVHMADISAATGFLLAATTSWGFFHHRWVAAKFVMTFGQLYLGIFVLSDRLDAAADTIRAGSTDGIPLLAVAATLMASAFAVQVWLSVAKPGGRTRWGRRVGKMPTAPTWLLALATLAPITDMIIGLGAGYPLPILWLAVLHIALLRRRTATRPAAV